MSNKKQGDWTDHLGESQMPEDEMTFTDGSNYGLDGFEFDTPEDEGVLEGPAYLSETKGLSGLPDGLVRASEKDLDLRALTESDEGVHFGAMLDEGGILTDAQKKAGSLADLDWLDPTQPQDPERLPKDLMQGEPPLDSVPELEEAWGAHRRTDGVHRIPARDLDDARYDANPGPHADLPGNKNASDEAVREAALSALRKAHYGVPVKTIKRELVATLGHDARRLRGVVARIESEYGLLGKVYIRASAFPGLRNGKWAKTLRQRCASAQYVFTDDEAVATKLSMEALPSGGDVPWKSIFAKYAPGLRREGHNVPSKDRRALKAALVASTRVPQAVSANYDGAGTEVLQDAQVARQTAFETVVEKQSKVDQSQLKKAKLKLAKAVKAGQLTKKEAHRLVAKATDAAHLSKLTAAAVQAAPSMREDEITFKEAAEYQGVPQKAAIQTRIPMADMDPMTKQALEAVKGTDHKAGEVLGLVRWARMQMSEGTAGGDLDALLKVRFSQPLLKAASPLLKEVRATHEGLAGFLYVDAGAYASPTGTTGCEKGALKHRANALKTILAMDRCGSCTHKNADGKCSQYNKRLVDAAPTPDPKAYQKKALRMADAPDHEVTAALFDPQEYDLQPDGSVDIDPDIPAETISEVLFGGMEL